ncbi:MAG: AAA family ATPase [Gloeomargaritales cyanobacterium]
MGIEEDLDKLLCNLPFFIQENLKIHPNKDKLIEIVMDLGRRPEARFSSGPEYLSQKIISWQDLDYTIKRVSKFSNENRAGIERTLHRISCIRNRQSLINGLTCRVGRAIFGTICGIRDLLESGQSILILGKPGVGKTTIIREIARVLSDEMEKRVVIVDTSNEIAGDSDIPHPGIGRARRMQVAKTELQHQVMIEAVENHMPEVIIIDEIGTELEALAARTIAEKGVQLVGTTHGNCLKNLIKNPTLTDLIGGIQYVTLSDDEAKRRGTQKSILERKAYPAFQIVIEINDQNCWIIHENVQNSIDWLLRGNTVFTQIRYMDSNQRVHIGSKGSHSETFSYFKNFHTSEIKSNFNPTRSVTFNHYTKIKSPNLKSEKLCLYSYSLSKNLIKEALIKTKLRLVLTKDIKKADLIIGLKKRLKQNRKLKKLAAQKNIPIYSINRGSLYQLTKLLQLITNMTLSF